MAGRLKRTLPCCGYVVDSDTVMDKEDAQPKVGDFSLCIRCGAWLRYVDEDLSQRVFDVEQDILDLTDEQREKMRRATSLIHQMQAMAAAGKLAPSAPFTVRRRPRRR